MTMLHQQQRQQQRSLLAVVLLVLTAARTAAQPCDLDCANGSQCAFGETSFTDHPTQANGDSFEFHESNNIDNMHCVCSSDYTGVRCEVPFESCNEQHSCYHGGACIDGLVDVYGNHHHFCDCTYAVDSQGNQYVGKFCEQQASMYCPSSQNQEDFCLNGGRCNSEYPDFGTPCLCPQGFSGDHCEYHEDSVPDCELQCLHGGRCALGTDHVSPYDLWEEDDHPNQYCICPDNWDGRHCEVPAVSCGHHLCFHGATCQTTLIEGKEAHHCDCTTADDQEASYAGLYCQYEATSYCTKDASLNGELFCVNGGTCQDNPIDGCACETGYIGFSCEFLDPEHHGLNNGTKTIETAGQPQQEIVVEIPDCDLFCFNNGNCRHGAKDEKYLDDIAPNTLHLNETHTEDFMHCVCPDGYTGVQCEHEIDVCDADHGEHVCLHGSQCVLEEHDYECNCTNARSNISGVETTNFAGDHCEHPVNDICTETEPAPGQPLSFCVNGGSCVRRISAGEAHPGCVCEEGFTGPHCELHESQQNNQGGGGGGSGGGSGSQSTSPNSSGSSSNGGKGLQAVTITISLLAIIFVSMYFATLYMRGRFQRQREAATLWKHPSHRRIGGSGSVGIFRDNPNSYATVNLAPKSKQEADDQYLAAIHSSTDPFTTPLSPSPAPASAAPDLMDDSRAVVSPVASPDEDSDDQTRPLASARSPQVYIGPPRDEDGHELHSVDIL